MLYVMQRLRAILGLAKQPDMGPDGQVNGEADVTTAKRKTNQPTKSLGSTAWDPVAPALLPRPCVPAFRSRVCDDERACEREDILSKGGHEGGGATLGGGGTQPSPRTTL